MSARLSKCTASLALVLMVGSAIGAESLTDSEIEAFLATLPRDADIPRPTVADFRSTLIVDARGQRSPTLAEYRDHYEWQVLPLRLVREHYPDVLSRVDLPADFTLAFLLKRKTDVFARSSGVVAAVPGESVVKTLERVFPALASSQVASAGWQCFLAVPDRHGRFCVGYAVLR